jgi:alpha-N-arabinofuranosidase
MVGGALITLLNNADGVKTACLAQLVNAIAPIMTETGGGAWRQTIFHPFAQASRFGHGRVMQARTDSTSFEAAEAGEIPHLCTSVVDHRQSGTTTIFALNRSTSVSLRGSLQLPINLLRL